MRTYAMNGTRIDFPDRPLPATEDTGEANTMTMREKMARAMAQVFAAGCDPDAEVTCSPPLEFPSPHGTARTMPPEEYRFPYWKLFLRSADAALDALMEPTEGMVEGGARSCGDERANPDEPSARACWDAMIRAAKSGQ